MLTKIMASVAAAVAVTAGGLSYYANSTSGGCPFSAGTCGAQQAACASDISDCCAMSKTTCSGNLELASLKDNSTAVAAIAGCCVPGTACCETGEVCCPTAASK